MNEVSHVYGPYWQGSRDAPLFIPVTPILHVHMAEEVPPTRRISETIWLGIDDAPTDWQKHPRWTRRILETVVQFGHAARRGPVLSTCNMGLNRSGLITGLALVLDEGMTAREAIRLIRRARGDSALSNRSFVRFIRYVEKASAR